MNGKFAILVKREFWETRSLWLAPAIAGGVLLVLWIITMIAANAYTADMGNFNWGGARIRNPGAFVGAPSVGLWGLASQLYLVSMLVCGIYLLDCLYAERKDRSILFWKSLPVSDRDTVLSKFVVATVIVPVGVFLLVSLLFPICLALASAFGPARPAGAPDWGFTGWLRSEGQLLGAVVVTMLWYAPLAAWNMLASVLARRSPIVLASLPVVVTAVCENIIFNTPHVWKQVAYRLMPVTDPLAGLQRPGLWIGLAVAAGMLYIVIRLRRYRDDT
jgi:ABC-2 type transport system permease protein